MQRSQIRTGLYLLGGSIVIISLISFRSDALEWLLPLGEGWRPALLPWGLVGAGLVGCSGIAVIISGILRPADPRRPRVRLLPALLLLLLSLVLFGVLFILSMDTSVPPRIRPGQSITI